MSSQSELFDRAAECWRRVLAVSDSRKLSLKHLCEMWIALANESPTMSKLDLDREVASIEAMQARIDPQH